MSGHTGRRIDDLDIKVHSNTNDIAQLIADLRAAETRIEDLQERIDFLEAETTADYSAAIRGLGEDIDDLKQYLLRRDGVPHLGRYAKTHTELLQQGVIDAERIT